MFYPTIPLITKLKLVQQPFKLGANLPVLLKLFLNSCTILKVIEYTYSWILYIEYYGILRDAEYRYGSSFPCTSYSRILYIEYYCSG